MKTCAILLTALFLAACRTVDPAGDGAASDEEWIERTSEVRRLSCYSGDSFGSRYGRSAPLTADGSGKVAWSEVRAIASQSGDETTRACRNVSRLWVSEGSGSDPVLAFEQNPGAEGRNGNSLVPIAWSADGQRLLFELDTWTYYTDRDPPILAIWPGTGGEVDRIAIEPAMRSRYGAECAFSLRSLGFSQDGRVLIETGALAEQEMGLPPCAPSTQRWTVESDGSIRPLS